MIDFNKPVRTKSGEPVEIVTTEGREPYPVIGYVEDSDVPECWAKDGRYKDEEVTLSLDLENIPQKRSGWVNVYTIKGPGVFRDRIVHENNVYERREQAEIAGRGYGDYIATAYIEWEE